jgi:hypothetical protein
MDNELRDSVITNFKNLYVWWQLCLLEKIQIYSFICSLCNCETISSMIETELLSEGQGQGGFVY